MILILTCSSFLKKMAFEEEILYESREVIEYLVKRYSFDFKTLLQDESTDLMMPSMTR